MNSQVKPHIYKMVKEAVEALGGITTNIVVRDRIQKMYHGTNQTTIGCQINVNHVSRRFAIWEQ